MLISLILLTPLFFFPIHDGFGIAKVAYMAVLAAFAAYRLWRMDGVRIPHWGALGAIMVGLVIGMKEVINWYEYLLQAGMDIAGITFLIYAANVERSGRQVSRIIAGTALAFSGFAFVLWISKIPFYAARPEWAWESTMGNTGFAAGMIAAMFPPVAWLAWKEKKAWLWLTLGLMVIHLDFTLSKTPMISLLVAGFLAVFVTYFMAPRLRIWRIAVAMSLLILITWGAATGMSAIDIARPESLQIRQIYWSGAILMIQDFPFFGVGRGNFQSYFPPYGAQSGDLGTFLVDYAHNDYLQIIAEMGPIGLAGFVGLFVLSWIRALKDRGWRLSMALGLVTIAINALTFFPMHTAGIATYFWVYAGMIGREA